MKATTLTSEQLSELRQHLLSIYAILGIPSPVLSASSVNYTSKTKSELADLAGTTTRKAGSKELVGIAGAMGIVSLAALSAIPIVGAGVAVGTSAWLAKALKDKG